MKKKSTPPIEKGVKFLRVVEFRGYTLSSFSVSVLSKLFVHCLHEILFFFFFFFFFSFPPPPLVTKTTSYEVAHIYL